MIKKGFFAFVVLVLLLLGVSLGMRSDVHAEREIIINASPAEIYPYIANFKKFNSWSPWADIDPNTKYVFTGESGVGSKMEWTSDDSSVGKGSQEILETKLNERVKTKLTFDGRHSFATFFLAPQGEKTKLIWSFDADMGPNPFAKYMGLAIDSMVGPDFEKGLKRLKNTVEKK